MIAEAFRAFADALPEALLYLEDGERIDSANRAAANLLGTPVEELVGRSLADLCEDPRAARAYLETCARTAQMTPGALRLRGVNGDPVVLRAEGAAARRPEPGRRTPLVLRLRRRGGEGDRFFDLTQEIRQLHAEIRERRHAEALLDAQREVMELIIRGAPLAQTLDTLARAFEQQADDERIVSVLLISEDGTRLVHGAAPNLPEAYNRAIDGVALAPEGGSCLAAVHRREPVFSEDIATDPVWEAYREVALSHGLRACWSVPVLARSGEVMGTFALYFRHPRRPTARDVEMLELMTRICSVALERERLEREREDLLARERDARAEAERANQVKDEFLATVSHELRTPINAILGWASLLGESELDEATRARAYETIARNARAQGEIIEDLLDVSRIITGRLRLDLRPIELEPVVRAAADGVRPAAAAKRIRLEVSIRGREGVVQGDAERLQQVIWNLLSNAIKFTPVGGEVSIELVEDEERATITVRDSGCGIAAEKLPFIFERFWQADGTSRRRFGGLGLGLAIVRHLVEQHDGRVQAESAGEGRGATFTVTLPRLPAVLWSAIQDGEASGSDTVRNGRLDGLRLLVVEDEADTREILRHVFERHGAEVRLAASAKEALREMDARVPDALLCDIGMPDEDGYTLIREIRARRPEHGGRVPAAALTAFARDEDRERALAAGFQLHLAKPARPVEMVAAVRRLTLRGEER